MRGDDYRRVDADPGRIETRPCWHTGDMACLGVKGSWAGIAGVGRVESQVEPGDGVSCERRYSLTSLCNVERLAQALRAALAYREVASSGA